MRLVGFTVEIYYDAARSYRRQRKNHNLPVTSRIPHIQFKIRRHIPTLRTNPPHCMELSLEPAYTTEKLRAGAKIHKYKFGINNNTVHSIEVRYQASLWKRAKPHCSVKNTDTKRRECFPRVPRRTTRNLFYLSRRKC